MALLLASAALPWKLVTWESTSFSGHEQQGVCAQAPLYRTNGPCDARAPMMGQVTAGAVIAGAGAFQWWGARTRSRAPAPRWKALVVLGLGGLLAFVGSFLALYFFSTAPSEGAPDHAPADSRSGGWHNSNWLPGPGALYLSLILAIIAAALPVSKRGKHEPPETAPAGSPTFRNFVDSSERK